MPAPDGFLQTADLHGPHRITLTSAPDEWYLESVRWRGREIADQAVDFGFSFGARPELEIVVSNQGAAVDGTANDGIGAVDDYSVLLFQPIHRGRS